MKNVSLGIAGLAFLASGLFEFSSIASAQSGHDTQAIASHALSATIDFGNDDVVQPIKDGTDFRPVGAGADQIVTITVQFSRSLIGRPIIVEPLDGGSVTLPQNGLFVSPNGRVSFQFRTPILFGACRVAVHRPEDNNFVQFWIVDPNHPDDTPSNVIGIN